MSTINSNDLFIVQQASNGELAQVSDKNRSSLQANDLFIVQSGNDLYHVKASDVNSGGGQPCPGEEGTITSPVEVLTPPNGSGVAGSGTNYVPITSEITEIKAPGDFTFYTTAITNCLEVDSDYYKEWTNEPFLQTNTPVTVGTISDVFDNNDATRYNGKFKLDFSDLFPDAKKLRVGVSINGAVTTVYIYINGYAIATSPVNGDMEWDISLYNGNGETGLRTFECPSNSSGVYVSISYIEIDGRRLTNYENMPVQESFNQNFSKTPYFLGSSQPYETDGKVLSIENMFTNKLPLEFYQSSLPEENTTWVLDFGDFFNATKKVMFAYYQNGAGFLKLNGDLVSLPSGTGYKFFSFDLTEGLQTVEFGWNGNEFTSLTAIYVDDNNKLVDSKYEPVYDGIVYNDWTSAPIFNDNGNAPYSSYYIENLFDKSLSNYAGPAAGLWELQFGTIFQDARQVIIEYTDTIGNGVLSVNGVDLTDRELGSRIEIELFLDNGLQSIIWGYGTGGLYLTNITVDGKLLSLQEDYTYYWSKEPIFDKRGQANASATDITYAFNGTLSSYTSPSDSALPGFLYDFQEIFKDAKVVTIYGKATGTVTPLTINGTPVTFPTTNTDTRTSYNLVDGLRQIEINYGMYLAAIEVDDHLLLNSTIIDQTPNYIRRLTFSTDKNLQEFLKGDIVNPEYPEGYILNTMPEYKQVLVNRGYYIALDDSGSYVGHDILSKDVGSQVELTFEDDSELANIIGPGYVCDENGKLKQPESSPITEVNELINDSFEKIAISGLENTRFKRIIYGGGKYIIGGSTGADDDIPFGYSIDGVNWFPAVSYPNRQLTDLFDIAYGNGVYLCTCSTSAGSTDVLYSTDGINWVNGVTAIVNKGCKSITFAENRFVALGSSGAYFSTDGVEWTYEKFAGGLSSTYTSTAKRLIYIKDQRYSFTEKGRYFFCNYNASVSLFTSTDCVSWDSYTSSSVYSYANDLIYENGVLCASCNSGYFSFSIDGGETFTNVTSTNMQVQPDISYCIGGAGMFLYSSTYGLNFAYSPYGSRKLPDTTLELRNFNGLFNDGNFYLFDTQATNKGILFKSNTGFLNKVSELTLTDDTDTEFMSVGDRTEKGVISKIDGNKVSIINDIGGWVKPYNASYALVGCTYGNGCDVFIDTNDTYVYYAENENRFLYKSSMLPSTNLTYLTYGLATPFSKGYFVAVDYDGKAYISYADDAFKTAWEEVEMPITDVVSVNWFIDGTNSLIPDKGILVATSYNGSIATSYDAQIWTQRTSPTLGQINNTCYAFNQIFAVVAKPQVGEDTISIISSPDGINWTVRCDGYGFGRNWTDITFANGIIAAVSTDTNGDGKKLLTSTDGTNWTLGTLPTGDWISITSNNYRFVALNNSNSNQIAYSDNAQDWFVDNVDDTDDDLVFNRIYHNNHYFIVTSTSSAKHYYNYTGSPSEESYSVDETFSIDPIIGSFQSVVYYDEYLSLGLDEFRGTWYEGLHLAGNRITSSAPSPNDITFTSMNAGSTPFTGINASLSSRTWALDTSDTASGPWTNVGYYEDTDANFSQDGASPWSQHPLLTPDTFYRVKVTYNSANADSVESVYNTFKTGLA